MNKSIAERKPSKIFIYLFVFKYYYYFGTNGQIHCKKETFQDFF
jgi:hypothetical protein